MSTRSLLAFLEAPIVVGDPDGRVAYVNPAFESRFSVAGDDVVGGPLAVLFEGGAREAVLRAVAEACEAGETVRFSARQGGIGYSAVASPIVAEDARVGVVILLLENSAADERLLALHREIQEPVDELVRSLDEMLEQTGGRRDERYRSMLEDGIRALARIRKWSSELGELLAGRARDAQGEVRCDPARVVGDATSRVTTDFAAAGVDFEAQVPAGLPLARGDGEHLEMALVWLLRSRLKDCGRGSSVSLSARSIDREGRSSVIISVVDSHGERGGSLMDPMEPDPELVLRIVSELGGDLRTTADPVAGRTSAIRLDACD